MVREGGPCVAHRVCAIPQCESKILVRSRLDSSTRALSLATLPTSLKAKTSFFLSPSMAKPAESYPRYSRRERPAIGQKQGISFVLVWLAGCGCHVTDSGALPIAEKQSLRTVDQGIDNELAVLFHQIIDVAKDATTTRNNRSAMSPRQLSENCVS